MLPQKTSVFIIILSFFLFNLSLCAQTKNVDEGFNFKLRKVVRNSEKYEVSSSPYVINTGKDRKKIQIRFRIKSLSKKREDFDPNKFSLVSEKYKVRFRPIDVKYNKFMTAYFGFGYLVNHKLEGKNRAFYINYKPEIKDTFKKYSQDGYQDIETKINFGSNKEKNLKSVYYDHKKLRSNIVDFYFSVPLEFSKGVIFYGNQELFEIDEID